MEGDSRAHRTKVLIAFAIIYFVWGSTFLAIRIGVLEVPPLLFAGMRFLTAGIALYGWLRLRGSPSPAPREWGSATLLAVLIFLLDYGFLFWAERRVPSGTAAILMATIPLFMALSEIVILGTQRLSLRLAGALLVGLGGVAVLVSPTVSLGEAPVDAVGAAALVVASLSWSVASALSRKVPLPADKMMSSAAQMLVGGAMLLVVAALFGELQEFHPESVSRRAWLALAYQIVAGSIVAFTAYVWLLHHESPTRVGTYAYVNPVVAVLIGYFLGGETLGPRTIAGTLLVLISVVVLTTTPQAEGKATRFVPRRANEG